MCIDFMDLNNVCPKDSYPLPSIDSLVDSASGCGLLSFMDAFLGYNQIRMQPQDEEKTTFIAKNHQLLSQGNAFWTEECESDIPMVDG